MQPDVITVAEMAGGVVILSVVRPVGVESAEHVFRILHGGQAVGEADTISGAADIAEEASARGSLWG